MKMLYILVGQKGSGKTYIGTLIANRTDIHFFRVEDFWIKLNIQNLTDEAIVDGYKKLEEEIDKRFISFDSMIIESTASHPESIKSIERLKNKYGVKLIHIVAPSETCLTRIRTRDQSIHIPVSDDRIEEINKIASKVDLPFDLVIENEGKTDDEIMEMFKQMD